MINADHSRNAIRSIYAKSGAEGEACGIGVTDRNEVFSVKNLILKFVGKYVGNNENFKPYGFGVIESNEVRTY